MYDLNKILKVGGAPGYFGPASLDSAFIIDISAGYGVNPTVTKLKPMAMARTFNSSVVLPSGDVVVTGGSGVASVDMTTSTLMPEIWSPKTGEFRRLKPMAVPRDYHGTSTLMLDGRIAVGGVGSCGGCVDRYDFQILTPPYLLDANGNPANRPVITAAPATAALGSTVNLTTDRSAASFALVRMSATTHAVNSDQRRVPLMPASTNGTSYQLALPADAGALLSGNWMLFAMDEKGVPSVAKVVRIQ